MLCGRPGWLVSECKRISGGRDSVDIDRAHRSRCPGIGGSWRDGHSICEDVFAQLEHIRPYQYRFCCLECVPVWLKRLAVDARAAGTSAQSSPDISGATYYRVTRIDLLPADPNANWFAVTAWQR